MLIKKNTHAPLFFFVGLYVVKTVLFNFNFLDFNNKINQTEVYLFVYYYFWINFWFIYIFFSLVLVFFISFFYLKKYCIFSFIYVYVYELFDYFISLFNVFFLNAFLDNFNLFLLNSVNKVHPFVFYLSLVCFFISLGGLFLSYMGFFFFQNCTVFSFFQ